MLPPLQTFRTPPLSLTRKLVFPPQRLSKRVKLVRSLITEVAGMSPYEKRIRDIIVVRHQCTCTAALRPVACRGWWLIRLLVCAYV